MYLTKEQCDILSGLCDRFEVAIRSYVSDVIVSNMNEEEFWNSLKEMGQKFKSFNFMPVNTKKYKEKAFFLAKKETYQRLKNSRNSYMAYEIIEGNVVSLGILIDLIILFYNPYFTTLGIRFDSVEQFVENLRVYVNIRNSLAHIASAKIHKNDAEKIMSFIYVISVDIDDNYFWYSSKSEINKIIVDLTDLLKKDIPIKNNLHIIPKKHNQLLLREKEIKDLTLLICGDSLFGRVSGSVELHGYGGVGKTALAMEFCYEIIRRVMNEWELIYTFILWLSSKTEELTYYSTTGSIYIKEIGPDYTGSDDIIFSINSLLDLDLTKEEEIIEYISTNKINGLVVLDNIENLGNEEKMNIKKLINRFPRCIQFILTSRDYEGIAENDLHVQGFSNIEDGKEFVNQYCKIKGYEGELDENDLEKLLEYSYGNTLILVLSLDRIFDGTSSLKSIIEDLYMHKGTELETVVDFMYKYTFDSTLYEIKKMNLSIDVKNLLNIILLYKEPIDFHSLRELLETKNAKDLEVVLIKLTMKNVLVRTEGYFELHEFAQKFVVLKMLPDKLRINEMQRIIHQYKNSIKESLKQLYEDKRNYADIKPILEEWKPLTEAETIAISQAYSEYQKVKKQLEKINGVEGLRNLIEQEMEKFNNIEGRSYHPYIKFQKARILRLIQRNKFIRDFEEKEFYNLDKEIGSAYEESYFTINFKHKYISKTESYAAFLWLYGIYLADKDNLEDAARILEESIDCFGSLSKVRNKKNKIAVYILLARVYSFMYLQNKNVQYLDKIKGLVIEARRLCNKIYINKHDYRALEVVEMFVDVSIGGYNNKLIKKKLYGCYYSHHLKPLVDEIKNNIF